MKILNKIIYELIEIIYLTSTGKTDRKKKLNEEHQKQV